MIPSTAAWTSALPKTAPRSGRVARRPSGGRRAGGGRRYFAGAAVTDYVA